MSEELGFPDKFASDLRALERMTTSPVTGDAIVISLPRVEPEDLVEGEWYVMRTDEGFDHVRFSREDWSIAVGEFGADGFQFWGPLPEFKLEE